jgi:hypothetical protein
MLAVFLKIKNMKATTRFFFITIILFLPFNLASYSQVLKLKSTSFSSKYKINDYNWSEWAEWQNVSVLITIDITKERITIYSKATQVYDIAENEGESYDSDGDKTLSLYCVDKDGLTCRIRLLKLISQDNRTQLYVDYNDMKWVYNVYSLD